RARRVDGDDVVRVLEVGADDRADDLRLVAIAVGEARPKRTVDEPRRQDRLVGRSALAPEERSGDLAGRVHPLLDVDGEREEVDAFPDARGRVGGDEDGGLADAADDRAL